jgi:3-dehydroshikimate dehydratase
MRIPALLFGGVIAYAPLTANGETFLVNKTTDDETPHTLRWAILQNNAHPGGHRIQIVPTGSPEVPWVIQLNSILPPIEGPAAVVGLKRQVGQRDAPDVIIDGANFVDGNNQQSCPGTGGGFGINTRNLNGAALSVVDSGDVEISGLEIRNVCTGIMLLRAHDNHIHHNVIHNTAGAAGIAVTGDAGDAGGSATSGLSIFNLIEYNLIYETGDGLECTRGTSFTTYQYNTLYDLRDRGNSAPYSQGIECAGSGNDHITLRYNTFTGFSDGMQLNSATNVLAEGNTIVGSTFGITSTAGGSAVIRNNVIKGGRMGVGPNARSRYTITENSIYDNGHPLLSLAGSAGGTTDANSPTLLGIDVQSNGRTPNDLAANCADGLPDCDTIQNPGMQNFPGVAPNSSWNSAGIVLRGNLPSRPNQTFTIEFFANHGPNAAGNVEGERFLGSTQVTTDANGAAVFAFNVPTSDPLGDGSASAYFTATATSALSGATSEFSDGVLLTK